LLLLSLSISTATRPIATIVFRFRDIKLIKVPSIKESKHTTIIANVNLKKIKDKDTISRLK
jgi:hypothetical protein